MERALLCGPNPLAWCFSFLNDTDKKARSRPSELTSFSIWGRATDPIISLTAPVSSKHERFNKTTHQATIQKSLNFLDKMNSQKNLIVKTYRHLIKARQLALLGLLLHALVPAGFMPASLDEGWYVKPCQESSLAYSMSGHDDHHHHANDDEASFEHCDLGGFSSFAEIQPDSAAEFLVFSAAPILIGASDRYSRITTFSYLARAPPIS